MEEVLNHQTNHSVSVSLILDWLERHFNTENIKGSLSDLPEAISGQKFIVRKYRDAFQEADLPRKMAELEMIDDIASEKNYETGKTMYSNDKMRDAELKRRKANNEEYQDYQQQAKVAEREMSAAEDELARLEQRFSAYQHVSNFVAAEMMLAAGLLKVPRSLQTGVGVNIEESNKQPF